MSLWAHYEEGNKKLQNCVQIKKELYKTFFIYLVNKHYLNKSLCRMKIGDDKQVRVTKIESLTFQFQIEFARFAILH